MLAWFANPARSSADAARCSKTLDRKQRQRGKVTDRARRLGPANLWRRRSGLLPRTSPPRQPPACGAGNPLRTGPRCAGLVVPRPAAPVGSTGRRTKLHEPASPELRQKAPGLRRVKTCVEAASLRNRQKTATMSFLKSIWKNNNSKHKKLSDEWQLDGDKDCEPDLPADGVSYLVKYLGSTLIETPSSEEATAEAIKTIITMAKASGKKLPRVELCINLDGIKTVYPTTQDTHLEVSIYRISYCSADATHSHVFAFIATNSNETMECHAFLCPKRKTTQAVTLTVAQSFNTAYQLWQLSQETARSESALGHTSRYASQKQDAINAKLNSSCSRPAEVKKYEPQTRLMDNETHHDSKTMLIDLSSEDDSLTDNGNSWVSFEDDWPETMNSNFARLTASQNLFTTSSPQHQREVLQAGGCSGWGDGPVGWGQARSIDLLCQ
ncbi:low density lipoprotein receptor adapter protein 1-A-like [Bacillus rossius redtenbacheri]|uniref:low density lipoprotein receptor adapter protein 1-A-like n=1 Tax=Bacillus rossius redtenbacheri TaxID=93214 RepID=UPI002FDCE4DF